MPMGSEFAMPKTWPRFALRLAPMTWAGVFQPSIHRIDGFVIYLHAR